MITNSKDQSIKLWDMRKFSRQEGVEATLSKVQQQTWDYRWQNVPKNGERDRGSLVTRSLVFVTCSTLDTLLVTQAGSLRMGLSLTKYIFGGRMSSWW